jgi:hypothetical protein
METDGTPDQRRKRRPASSAHDGEQGGTELRNDELRDRAIKAAGPGWDMEATNEAR